MGSLQTKVVMVGLARLAAAAAAVITNIALARFLTRELNGLAQQALIVVNVVILLGQSGIQASCYTFFPRLAPESRRPFFLQSLLLLILLGALALGAVLLMAHPLAGAWDSPRLVPLLRVLGLYVLFSIGSSAAEAAMITENRSIRFLTATMGWAALHAGGVVVLLLLGRSLEMVFGLLSVAAMVRFVLFVSLGWASLPTGPARLETGLLLRQLAFIAPLAIHGAVDVFSRWLDRSLISTLFTPEQLAVYTYGALEIPFVGILIGAVMPVLLPELSAAWGRNDRARILDLWGRATVRVAAFLLPLLFFLFPLAIAYLQVFYSEKYVDSAPFLRAYLLLMPVRVIAFTPMLFALGRSGWVLAGGLIDLVLNFTVSVLLIPGLGMLGPAVGTVASTWVQAVAYLLVIRAALATPLGNLLPWRRLRRIACETALVSLPLWGLTSLSLPSVAVFLIGGGYCGLWAILRIRKIW